MKDYGKTYLCTRSRIARLLFDQGMEATKVPNPWEPERDAWVFPLTATTVAVVTEFYQEIGKPVPKYIRQAADAMGAEVS